MRPMTEVVPLSQTSVTPCCAGAVGEEPDGLPAADRVGVVVIGRGVEGGDPVDALTVDAERLAACREQREFRTTPKQSVRELGAHVDNVLAVVQQQQQAPLADCFDERVDDGSAWVLTYAEHVCNGDSDEVRVLKWSEIHKPDSVA